MAVTGSLKWICQDCTYINWGPSTTCTMCGSAKPMEVIPRTCSGKYRPHTQMTISWPKAAASSPSSYSSGAASYTPEIICPDYNYPVTSHADTHTSKKKRHSSKEKWVCAACTYSNWPNANQCTICRAPRSRSEPRSSEARLPSRGESILDYASCVGAVGGAYVATDDKVPMCGREITVHPPEVKNSKNKMMSNLESRTSKKWKCYSCTYENWPRATKCIMCQMPRKRTPSPPLSGEDSRLRHHLPDNSSPVNLHSRSGSNSNEHGASCSQIQASSPSASNSRLNMYTSDPPPEILPSSSLKSANDEVRQIRNRLSSLDWLFLNACLGVANDEEASVKAYLRQDGDRGRHLTRDECLVLGEPATFTVGSTLVHLAIK